MNSHSYFKIIRRSSVEVTKFNARPLARKGFVNCLRGSKHPIPHKYIENGASSEIHALTVKKSMVEEICHKFLRIVIPEYDQRNTLQAVRKMRNYVFVV